LARASAAHDGFTLCDIVSYNEKDNEANKDDNTDGANENDSWNMGAEGRPDDAAINNLRERQISNFLATLMLSQGIPMLAGETRLQALNGATTIATIRTTSSHGSIMDTENIDDPFVESKLGESIIAGGRSFRLLSDDHNV
jgi:hypothetical protein